MGPDEHLTQRVLTRHSTCSHRLMRCTRIYSEIYGDMSQYTRQPHSTRVSSRLASSPLARSRFLRERTHTLRTFREHYNNIPRFCRVSVAPSASLKGLLTISYSISRNSPHSPPSLLQHSPQPRFPGEFPILPFSTPPPPFPKNQFVSPQGKIITGGNAITSSRPPLFHRPPTVSRFHLNIFLVHFAGGTINVIFETPGRRRDKSLRPLLPEEAPRHVFCPLSGEVLKTKRNHCKMNKRKKDE